MNVFTTVEYPQFNGHRNTHDLIKYISEAEEVDLSTLSAEDAEKLTAALDRAKAVLATTIIVEGEAEAAENELYNALADIGLREKQDDTMDNILLVVCKTASELIYRYFGPRGFSDPYGV